MKTPWGIVLTLAISVTTMAGEKSFVFVPLPPRLVISSWPIETVFDMDVVYVRSEWVVDRFLHIEVVTDGIQINWINETPWWAVSPEPNAYLLYNFKFDSYCRFIAFGEDDRPQWECVSRRAEREIFYQRFDYKDGIWGRRIWRFDRIVEVK